MRIGVPAETRSGETRVAATAETVKKLVAAGHQIVVQAGAGIAAWRQLPIDAVPDIAPTQVKLILKAPGMTPQEVEQRILVPLEMELLGLPRQVQLRALAKYAIADVTLVFEDGTDIYWARQQVAERYAGVRDALPAGVELSLIHISEPTRPY